MLDKVLSRASVALTYAIIALMLVLLVGGIFLKRGSLDDLPADQIKDAVDRAT